MLYFATVLEYRIVHSAMVICRPQLFSLNKLNFQMYVMYYSLLEGICNDANHNTSCFGVLGWVGACVCGECEWKGAKND